MAKKKNIFAGLFFCLLTAVLISSEVSAASIKLGEGSGTNANRHNFSINNNRAGTVLQANDPADPNATRLCVFCHTPHGASAESTLWNRLDPAGGPFGLYGQISGNDANILIDDDPQVAPLAQYGGADYPNGATKLCLSCHDGVTAVGDMFNGTLIQMNFTTMDDWVVAGGNDAAVLDSASGGSANGTLSLDGTHPVSFFYTADVVTEINNDKPGAYQYPADRTMLDTQERFQCTSCHDPHLDTNDGTYRLPFWRGYTGVEQTDYDAVCDSCHIAAPLSPTDPGGFGGNHNL